MDRKILNNTQCDKGIRLKQTLPVVAMLLIVNDIVYMHQGLLQMAKKK